MSSESLPTQQQQSPSSPHINEHFVNEQYDAVLKPGQFNSVLPSLSSNENATANSYWQRLEFRSLTLKCNSLDVLLICDPKADKCAVSMDVAVGKFCDYDSVPGIAHFLGMPVQLLV